MQTAKIMKFVAVASMLAPCAGFLSPLRALDCGVTLQAHRESQSRKETLQVLGWSSGLAGLAVSIGVRPAWAEEATKPPPPPPVNLDEPPTGYDLSHEYYADAKQMLNHMKYATFMNRDTPNYENIAKSVKGEMTDFLAYYRRFNSVAGKPSFSTLYTAINVIAGHYASYGPKFPIPEKRRKRLSQEFNEVERNIRRNR